MKILLVFASFVCLTSAYQSYLSLNGKELINHGRASKKGQLNSISLKSKSKPLSDFKPKSFASAKKPTLGAFASFKSKQTLAATSIQKAPKIKIPQVIEPVTVQLETPTQPAQPNQLFAILVPAEEVSTLSAPANAIAAPQVIKAAHTSLPISTAPQTVQPGTTITAAVQTKYSLQTIDVPSSGEAPPTQEIIIPANSQPIDISFHSQSSPITVRQVHIPGQPGPPQESSHEEEPDLLKQQIIKPIIHEVTESIQPVRKITQEVRPVQEHITQLLSRGRQFNTIAKPIASQAAAQKIAFQPISAQGSQVATTPVFLAIIKANDQKNVIKK